MRILKQAFAKAKSGHGQVVGIVGEAGVGKSRLLREFRKALQDEWHTYLKVSCIHYGDTIPYLPFLQALMSYFGISVGDQELVTFTRLKTKINESDRAPVHILSPLCDVLSVKVEDEEYLGLEPAKKKDRMFEAIRDIILMASQERPVVLVIDDLHWIDPTSEVLLSQLVDEIATNPILLIMVYRPEYTHQWVNRSVYSQVRLNELSSQDSAELIDAILGDGRASPELCRFIIARTGGNPLFTEELVRSLREGGIIEKEKTQYQLRAMPSPAEIPASIHGIIAARIDQLDNQAKHVLRLASVIGPEFSLRTLESVASTAINLESSLSRLLRAEFIYRRSSSPQPQYVFKHVLTQEVAYHSLPRKSLKEIHQRVGRAIEEEHSDSLEGFHQVLAYHYSMAEDFAKAYEYLRLSADKAFRSFSNWEALRLYREAIDAVRKQGQGRDRQAKELEVHLAMDLPLRSLDYPDGSWENLQEAERLAEELGHEASKALVHSKMGWYHVVRGNAATGLKEAEAAFEEAVRAEDTDLMVPAAINLTQALQIVGDFQRQVEVASRAVALLERTHRELMYRGGMCNDNVYCTLLAWSGIALAHLGQFEDAVAALEKSLSFARQINDPASIPFALQLRGSLFWMRGDGQKAAEYLREALPYLERVGNPIMLGGCWANLGIACLLQGDCRTAAEYVDRGLELQQSCGAMAYLANFFWVKGWIETETRQIAQARIDLGESLRLAADNRERCMEGIASIYLGRAVSVGENPNHAEAEELICHGMRIFEVLGVKPWPAQGHLFLGELHAEMGNKEKALHHLKKAETAFAEMGMDYWRRKTQQATEKLRTSSTRLSSVIE